MISDNYINISCESEPIDELCVICLEFEDSFKKRTINHSKFLICKCKCNYHIHKNCFDKWLVARPNKQVRCLICSSDGDLVLTCEKKCVNNCVNYITGEICISHLIMVGKILGWVSCLLGLWFVLLILDYAQ